jgi:hypothetical protein
MKIEPGTLLVMFLWDMFIGVIVISIGLGAVFPDIERIAAPVVCNDDLYV